MKGLSFNYGTALYIVHSEAKVCASVPGSPSCLQSTIFGKASDFLHTLAVFLSAIPPAVGLVVLASLHSYVVCSFDPNVNPQLITCSVCIYLQY